MKNEKGLTLIELLGAITIFFIVIGVIYGLFSSVRLYVNQSEDIYTTKSTITLTESIITDYLSAPIELSYNPNAQELTFKTFDYQSYVLQFDQSAHMIKLFQGTDIIASIGDITKIEVTENNQLYYLSITYEVRKSNVHGAETVSDKKVTYTIKPFQM